MKGHYAIANTREIISPGLVIFKEILEENLQKMIEVAGNPARLRPHCKTHKMPAITRLELARGIHKHKCATFAEAEMLADAGAKDIFLAYNLVGPNIDRAIAFRRRYPDVRFSVTADHEGPIADLAAAMAKANATDQPRTSDLPGLCKARHGQPEVSDG